MSASTKSYHKKYITGMLRKAIGNVVHSAHCRHMDTATLVGIIRDVCDELINEELEKAKEIDEMKVS